MKVRISAGEKIFCIFNYTLLTALVLVCLYPFWHALMASFSDGYELIKHRGFLWKPAGFSLAAYEQVLSKKRVWTGYMNTLFLLIIQVPLSLVLTSLAAYFLSRENVLFKKPILLMFMFTMYFSGGMIPSYLNLKDLGLLNSLWGVILPSAISTWNVMILKTSFGSVPMSLCEAAKMDGAGHLRILWSVIIPLSKASLAVIALYYGLSIWNSWFWADILIRDPGKLPLQVILRNMIINTSPEELGVVNDNTVESLKYATMIVSIVPILCVYPFLQKHFTKGVLIGAVKG